MSKQRVSRHPGYSTGTYKGHHYVRTQRSAQFRWLLMGVGTVALGTAASLAYNTFTNEYSQARTLAETSVVAQEVDAYKPTIANALAEADDLAAQIGNEVADPSVVREHAALRHQARTLLAVKVVVPVSEDGPDVAFTHKEVANSMLAVDASLVPNLTAAQEKLKASHDAYQELVDARAEAAAARAATEAAIAQGQQVLFDTAPSMDGWIYVPEEIRVPLAEAIDAATVAIGATENKELSTVADFKGVAEGCRQAIGKINEQAEIVKSNVKMPPPPVALDENGNPIIVAPAPAPEQPAEAPAITG